MDRTAHEYAYSYDRTNRLLSGMSNESHGETLTYDKMGNITSLLRTGPPSIAGASGTFAYDYGNAGNQLQSFTNGSSYSRNFQYNSKGNVVADGQMKIDYNELNLPRQVKDYNNILKVDYLYDVQGRKLRKQSPQETRHYVNGIEYMQNGTGATVDFLHMQEGIARNIGGTYHYEYFLKDHLGNTRVVFDDGSAVLQQTDYYPFGMEINRKISSPKIQYTYNGKEFQEELGQYDYGARFYDPVVGRWNVVDPLAEAYQDWSPYNYVANNPLKFIDPNGMWIDDYRMRYDGRLEHLRDTKDNFDVIYNADNTESIKVTKSKIVQDDKSTTLTFKNDLFSANNLYEFIAQNTGVEFAKIDGFYGYNMIENVSILTTSHQESTVSTIPKMIVGLSNSGFVGRSISHIHPSGVQVPSGYYSNIEGNPLSMMPLLKSEVKYKDGDAANARITQQWPGFRNTKFELYTPKHNTKTLYDGYKKAGIIPLR